MDTFFPGAGFNLSPSLVGAVFASSLVGSIHCAGMCGPFVAVYSASGPGGDQRRSSVWGSHAAYHLARGVGYVALGALGGALGTALNFAGRIAGVVQFAAIFCSLLVVLWGASVLFPVLRLRSPVKTLFFPKLIQLGTKPRVFRASLLGGLTPLLPCGWLYAFVLTAAGTGSVFAGALVMATFWLGTVPALLGMGALLARVGETLRARVPVLTGVALIIIGGLGVFQRASMIGTASGATDTTVRTGGDLAEPKGKLKCH